ncbi:probable galacturonosyltransferase 7 [Vitis riparia]|uniref:probable galacturonosyltransferase 7 n=1 Tax=Vitis riparia TaxID=96939 RepID=UPI00155B16B4|nr:probable galacturonosyltransferase 7 [Vitis riparia]
MKGGVGGGGGSSYTFHPKRRWRGFVVAVLGLVILSMLVPLIFLLGLHNGFHSAGYVAEPRNAVPRSFDHYGNTRTWNQSEDVTESLGKKVGNRTIDEDATQVSPPKRGLSAPPPVMLKPPSGTNHTKIVVEVIKSVVDESEKSCELKFGSYCLWRQEHREDMKDMMVKKLKDRLFVARAYYPSVAKLPAHDKLSRELKQNIQELERVLSEASTDPELPPQIGKKLTRMEVAITRAKSITVDCNNVDKKLRQILDMTEDEADFHMKQSAFLYQLAIHTTPKSHHCLSMRLTVEYFKSPPLDMEVQQDEKYMNPTLQHYVIFSKNVLASTVVINSTVMHTEESGNQVFHVVTDGQNYFAMKLWFSRNTFRQAMVQVLNIEDLNLDHRDEAILLDLSLPQEFRISYGSANNLPTSSMRTEYMSIFSHSHYLLPEIFQNLKKVVILDDDIVVQQDLSALWSINMEGKVNGAVEFCTVRLGELKSYLGEKGVDEHSCAWMSGLNIIDLVRWREQDVTGLYRRLVQEKLSMGEESLGHVALRASLLSFQDLVYALDDTWVFSGLGHNYHLDTQAIKRAAVLHYNGNMKPWLELGIPKYRNYWRKFLNLDEQYLTECNVNP